MPPNWFIGIPVPAASWLPAVFDDAPEGLRRFHPADIHITVAFLGSVDSVAARASWAIAAMRPAPPVVAELGALRPFGPRSRPSAYSFVLIQGANRLMRYMLHMRGALLAAAGARPDMYDPLPHVTVARPPRGADQATRKRIAAWAANVTPPSDRLVLDRLALYTWSEDRSERQFQIVEEVGPDAS